MSAPIRSVQKHNPGFARFNTGKKTAVKIRLTRTQEFDAFINKHARRILEAEHGNFGSHHLPGSRADLCGKCANYQGAP